MIPFNQIDARLEALGKDRAWLASTTGRSLDAIRSALAPGAKPKSRSELLQRALSKAIEDAENQKAIVRLPDQLALAPTAAEFEAWDLASRAAKAKTLKDWAIDELNKAAAAWQASQLRPTLSVLTYPEIPLLHAAAGAPVCSDSDTYEPMREYGPGRFACQLHGDSMSPNYPDGSIVILRERNSLKRPVLKTGQIYLFDIAGEKTLKLYGSRVATAAEAESGISYLSPKDGKQKVAVLKPINPAFPEIVISEDANWLGWLDKDDN